METTTLQAEVRSESGKGPARRLRMDGKLPAVMYGPGVSPMPLTVDPVELRRSLEGPKGRNTLFTVKCDGTDHLAMVKDLEVEPVSRALVHADFLVVSTDRTVAADVRLTTSGRAVGVVKGGKLKVNRRTISVRCTPDKIPTVINIDVSSLDLHQSIRVKDLELAEGVEVTLKPELALATVTEAKRVAKDAAEAKEGAEAKPA